MNRTYALVWNPSLAAWTVTDERARRRAKGAGAVLAAALLLPLTAIAADLPTGGQVVAGSGAINQPNAQQMVIDQASNKLAIDWQSFDIGTGNKVTFNQPGRDAIALNRVLGADGSKIMGQLDANGRVFLINPNGVLFGSGAQVNVGGLVASTLNISDSDFAAGNYKFKGDGSNASVINNGQITAADGGSIALLGGTVSNNGVIVANQGSVALAAGNAVTLDFAGDGLLNVQVDEAVVDALVENHQLIKADGGQVLLTANAGDALLKTVVNNTGVIEAHTLGEKDGKIVLLGSFDGGTVQVAGTLDASAPNGGDGGFIETSGAHLKVADSAKVTTKATNGKTGTWLIDPNDFTIAASGGDMTGAALSTAVQNNNFEIQTATQGTAGGNGDIHVNDAVTWNSANTLTLNAERNININAAITAQHANGKVALKYGQASTDGGTADYHIAAPINLQSGSNFSTQKGSTGSVVTYTVVNDATALQDMNSNLNGNYAVGSHIDLSSISNWVPVGDGSNVFNGRFDGLGHTLSKLTIDRSDTDYVGLFGINAQGSVIRDIGLVGGSVKGAKSNNLNIGGLIGLNQGSISNAYATGSVTTTLNDDGFTRAGGLVGINQGTISNAYATGSVTANATLLGQTYVGGLVGVNDTTGTINNAYATGNVTGTVKNGGLKIGGLVGMNLKTISNAYASGSVEGFRESGGSGGLPSRGGLIGDNSSKVTNLYWDKDSTKRDDAFGSGNGNVSSITGIDSSNRYNHTSYTDLGTWALVAGTSNVYAASDSNGVQWIMIEGQTRPFLASEYSTSINNAHQLQLMAYNLGAHYTLAKNIDASATSGSNLSDMWSTSGFDPLGNDSNPFTGTFNGLSHTISDLTINRSGTSYVGLFGYTSSASTISDIGLVGGSVSGRGSDGSNGGNGGNGGDSYSGALAGYNAGTINNAYATASVSANGGSGGDGGDGGGNGGTGYSGGLVGYNASSGTINNAYATGTISANGGSGGFAGFFGAGGGGGGAHSGGLVGDNAGTINNAYATGTISANGGSGGNGGRGRGGGGDAHSGGLVGKNNEGKISNSFYATTDANSDPINNSGDTTEKFSGNAYGTGKTWAELKQASTFAGWNIATTGGSDAVWRIYDGHSTPLLRSFLKAVTITVDDVAGKTYDGTTGSVAGVSYSSSDNSASLLGSASYTSVATRNAGTYDLGLTGLYSNQQGYDITVEAGSYTIAKAALTITANDASKTAGQSIALSGYSASGLVGNDSISAVSLSSLGQPTTAAAGNYAIVASDAIGAALSNYAISYQDGTLLVNAAPITPTTPSSQQPTASTPPYIGVLASNGQSLSTQAPQQIRQETVSEPEVQKPQMLMTNPLADIMNLQVINQGIRLPEGI